MTDEELEKLHSSRFNEAFPGSKAVWMNGYRECEKRFLNALPTEESVKAKYRFIYDEPIERYFLASRRKGGNINCPVCQSSRVEAYTWKRLIPVSGGALVTIEPCHRCLHCEFEGYLGNDKERDTEIRAEIKEAEELIARHNAKE